MQERVQVEAEWSVEIGADLPRIVVPWSGPADSGEELRYIPLSVDAVEIAAGTAFGVQAISEARNHPALARALIALNQERSPVVTVKCDVWNIPADEIDRFDFDAGEDPNFGLASYVDVVQRAPERFVSFAFHERWMLRVARHLQPLPLRSSRIEMVLRPAEVFAAEGFGVTFYAMGCGADVAAAEAAWQAALGAAALAICDSQMLEPVIQGTRDATMS